MIEQIANIFSRPHTPRELEMGKAQLENQLAQLPPSAPADPMELAAAAKRLVEDPVLALCFENIEADLTRAMVNSQVGAREEREANYRLIWALKEVRSRLVKLMNDGKLVAAMEREKRQREAAEARRRELRMAGIE